jgi:hypothetical protein
VILDTVHFVPLLTTVLSAIFGTIVLGRCFRRPDRPHLGWWAAGIYLYGVGTLTESLVTLLGWGPVLFRLWYISGALLGGLPLAQGSVYFHFSRRTANRMTAVVVPYVALAALAVCLTPLDTALAEPHRLSGKVMIWHWVRLLSPLINLYAVIFLVGTAILSAVRYRRRQAPANLVAGNALIAVGAILPGVGGAFTRMGYVEVLYVAECLGLILIWRGYRLCTRPLEDAASTAAVAAL